MALLASVLCVSASTLSATADDTPGMVRLRARQPTPIRQTSYFNASALFDHGHGQKSSGCGTDCTEGCRTEGCGCGCSGNGKNYGLFGKLFGGRQANCNCYQCDYSRNGKGATLFDCLFGCMSPAGACGQGLGICRRGAGHQRGAADDREDEPQAAHGQAAGGRRRGDPNTPHCNALRHAMPGYSHTRHATAHRMGCIVPHHVSDTHRVRRCAAAHARAHARKGTPCG